MEATLVEREAVSATVKVTVPAAEVDATYARVLGTLARQVKVPGFRPGKAPRGVLIRRIGEDALGEEVRDALVDANYPKAIRELELAPVHAHFHADPPTEGADFEFEVHIDLYPEFELPDVTEIVIDTETPEVTETMVADAIEQLRRENATLVPVERPAEAGDFVMLESPDASEDAPGTLPLDLETAEDHLVEQLKGREMGEVIDLTLVVPGEEDADPDGESEEGTDGGAERPEPLAPLRLRIADIKAKEKPEADDEFARTLGMERWSEVEERIRDSLAQQLGRRAFDEQVDEFVEKLAAEADDFGLPTSLVNRRKLDLLERLGEDLQRQGGTLDGYLSELDQRDDRQRFDDDLERSARDGVRRDILLERLLEERGTELSDAEFADAVRHMASREGKDPQRFRRERGDQWLANYRFLLTRDRALRETVRELVGPHPAESSPEDEGAQEDEEGAGGEG